MQWTNKSTVQGLVRVFVYVFAPLIPQEGRGRIRGRPCRQGRGYARQDRGHVGQGAKPR